MGERLQERRRKSIKIFHGKEEWYLNDVFSGFRNATQSLRQEKKSQDSRNSKNDQEGRNWHNQLRKKNTMIAFLEVEVTTNITLINPQLTNPLKMTKKNGLH